MNGMFDGVYGERLRKALFFAVVVLGVFLIVETVNGFSSLRYVGSGVMPSNTITVSGIGEAYAVPDIGDFTFSVVSDKATVADAQTDATAKINALTQYLKDAGIDEKDIKTVDYSVYPQYEYSNSVCPANSGGTVIYCPPGRQTLKGYEVRQTTEVKVRDTAKAGDLLAGVGTKGATEVSGLSFTTEDPTAVQNEARSKAIADAKSKADELAKELGVRLVRIVSFNESGNYPYPIAYGKGGVAMDSTAASAPNISTGQNKTTSNVTVTYEIR